MVQEVITPDGEDYLPSFLNDAEEEPASGIPDADVSMEKEQSEQ